MPTYDPTRTAEYFDQLAEGEWNRLTAAPFQEISLYIHTHYLQQFIQPGMRVLEIGAGTGRFTQILAGLGARVVVGDLSEVQIALNRRFAADLGFAAAVEDWQQVDICDLSRFAPASFDAVVAYGGPFSYVLERRGQALAECRQALRPDGRLLLSVMSLWGTIHRFLGGVLDVPPEYNTCIITTGDLTSETHPNRPSHFMHLFRAAELDDFLVAGGFERLALSASACLSVHWDAQLPAIRQDPVRWQALLEMERAASADPGCWNTGTHILAAARKI